LNEIIHGDCLEVMRNIPNDHIDLILTSPPYDNLRTYNGFSFDFEGIANELYRVTKPGGVVVWVVNDATVKGSETGTSFRQALYFKEIGFNLHDTMIYKKESQPRQRNRYEQFFEYMFVFSKGKPKAANLLRVPSKNAGKVVKRTCRDNNKDVLSISENRVASTKTKGNVWYYGSKSNKYDHPAIFPEKLAEDHILSWSNPGDIVLDPMCGSGTTCKMAAKKGRQYIGIDISAEYCEIARKRVESRGAEL